MAYSLRAVLVADRNMARLFKYESFIALFLITLNGQLHIFWKVVKYQVQMSL